LLILPKNREFEIIVRPRDSPENTIECPSPSHAPRPFEALHQRNYRRRDFSIVDGCQPFSSEARFSLESAVHEIHAYSAKHPLLSFEFLLNERSAEDGFYRRDMRIRMPLDRAILHDIGGLPILCPAIVLLFQSQELQAKG